MNILIIKQNLPIVESVIGRAKVKAETTNTITLSIPVKKFTQLRDHLRAEGVNPFAFMTW